MDIIEKTYKELYDLYKDSVDVETPAGLSTMNSIGKIGGQMFVSFRNGYHYSPEHRFETDADQKKRSWMSKYEKLKKTQKTIILSQFPDLFDNNISELKPPDRIYIMAVKKIIKTGKIDYEVCTRCSGTGHHSWCSQYGTTCFKCAGAGKGLPSAGRVLKALKNN